jgi:itaconyl-CoA hydratase
MSIEGWSGRHFEDFTPGDVYRHPLGRTISAADNTWFTLMTMNTAQLHFNEVYAERSEFGQPLVVSTLTLAIAVGQSVTDTTQNGFANLGFEEIKFTKPVFAGDTLWSESMVLSVRESRSRPYSGIVKIKTRSLNQHGQEVLSFLRTFGVYKRDSNPFKSSFPEPETPISGGS